jgi:mono/diheme cytochrome c family protein
MKKLLFALLVSIPILTYSQEFEKGKEIFTTNCAGCHNMEQRVVGPALQDVIATQGRDWASKWISNNGELIKSGDAHANAVYEEYNKMAMPAFNYLKPEELNSLLDYLEGFKKDKEAKVAVAAPAAVAGGTTETKEGGTGLPIYMWILIILTLVILVVSAIIIITSLRLLDSHFAKIKVTNLELMKKLDLDTPEINSQVGKIFDKEVTKRVNEKVKTLRSDIDDKLKNFK